jgi:ACS family glucarate transporter-like MFS transporter
MVTPSGPVVPKSGRLRYGILLLIFMLTATNYADRSIISIAGPSLADELHFDAVTMGYIFSAFGWSYVIGQLPGGWILDKFGTKWIYAASITLWSAFTIFQGAVGFFTGATAVGLLFALRFLVGLAEAPSMPANARVVSAWFPTAERGFASAAFNSGQYFATVLFAPLMGWIVHDFGWRYVFVVMGVFGLAMALLWLKVIHPPRLHPRLGKAELDHIEQGGALVDLEDRKQAKTAGPGWAAIKQLMSIRMVVGIYVAQYCITTLTYFFLTWFPVYLVKERGLSILQAGFAAALPALCGFIGGLLGGAISDAILRRTGSLTWARKIPIIGGMLLSMVILACNYVDNAGLVVGLMTLSFFGKGVGSLGWAVVADTSPREAPGLHAGLFNTFGNVAGITTPIAIGYIIQANGGSFTWALVFVAINAAAAMAAYLFVVGDIRRVTLKL